MTFLESASLIGSQVLANWLVSSNDVHKNMVSPSTATAILALLCIIFIAREWRESSPVTFKEYRVSLKTHIFSGKDISLLEVLRKIERQGQTIFKNNNVLEN